ncbi:MAG: DUF2804 domain-containing protein, partial [Clostridia bacterium]
KMQHLVTNRQQLLDKSGNLTEAGYSTHAVFEYDAKKIKANKLRIKEWDFYQISNSEWCLQMTIGHVSYCSSINCSLFNIYTGERYEIGKLKAFPMLSMGMENSAEKDYTLSVADKSFIMNFTVTNKGRHLYLKASNDKYAKVEVDLMLDNDYSRDKMVIATPFEENKHFFYNYKENCYAVEGYARFDSKIVYLSDAFGLLDWGRGVWPFAHSWIWGNGSTKLSDGKMFGFNIGWGFGNTEKATENMVFYDYKASKLGDITLTRNEENLLEPWTFVESSGRMRLTMQPIFDNFTQTKILFVNNKCHQVFGKFSGFVILDDGKVIEVDNMTAFCENANNHW